MKSSPAMVTLTVDVDILNLEQLPDDVLSPPETSLHKRSTVQSVFDVDINPGLSQEEIHQIPVVTFGSEVKSGPEKTLLPPPVDIRSPRQEDSGQLQVSIMAGIEEEISGREGRRERHTDWTCSFLSLLAGQYLS